MSKVSLLVSLIPLLLCVSAIGLASSRSRSRDEWNVAAPADSSLACRLIDLRKMDSPFRAHGHSTARRLAGDWLSTGGVPRFLRLEADGSFLLLSWPWAFAGRYEDSARSSTIVMRPARPLYGGISEVTFNYAFKDQDHLLICDPDSDIFLVSTPLEFERWTEYPGYGKESGGAFLHRRKLDQDVASPKVPSQNVLFFSSIHTADR